MGAVGASVHKNAFENVTTLNFLHPWAGEDLSLKIDEHDQTVWICILEL